jgi:hypothetical protein
MVAASLMAVGVPLDPSALTTANRLYQEGHYAEAIQAYKQMQAVGTQDSALLYNLGNAYLQQGDLGQAIAHYQRAVRLAPRDADIQANLAYARSLVVEPFADAPAGPIHVLADATGTWLSPNETALLALGLWFALGWLRLARGRSQSREKAGSHPRAGGRSTLHAALGYATVGVLFLVLLTGLSLGSRIYLDRAQPGGVVVSDELSVYGTPGPESAVGFSLREGAEVGLIKTQGDWAHLLVPGHDLDGWVAADGIVPI